MNVCRGWYITVEQDGKGMQRLHKPSCVWPLESQDTGVYLLSEHCTGVLPCAGHVWSVGWKSTPWSPG